MSKLEQVIFNIKNMSMEEFCARVNKFARATRYCEAHRKVCEILEVRDSVIKVVRLDPEYFGSETTYIVVNNPLENEFKDLFIRGMLSGWNDCKYDYISNFAD